MNRRELLATTAAALAMPPSLALTPRPIGADMPWTTYLAAGMKTSGALLGPAYGPFRVESEASAQTCVKLGNTGAFVEFTLRAPANTMVLRFSLPDAPQGGGLDDVLTLYRNGERLCDIALSSRFAWAYGEYPFSNDPKDGKPRHFFDEVRLKDLQLAKGDVLRLTKTGPAPYCILDLVDMEQVAPPLRRPTGALSLSDFGADGKGTQDDTEALRALVAAAAKQSKIAFVPPGDYRLTGDIVLPANVTLQGAGMWHTRFVGDETLYPHWDRRLRFILAASNSHLADFALDGRLKYRNDDEKNDGIFGAGGSNCSVSRLWVEHTKVGMWFYLCRGIRIAGCRLRNTFADGINLCVDTRDCIIENCSARNTGDDCFAIWPAPADQGFAQESIAPGNNVIRRCTGQLPFLAQGGAIYGGANNRIEDCLFSDIASGCGILISTTFPTANDKIDNNFSGTTIVRHCTLIRCGGYDHGWTWRAALQICLHRKDIAGLRLSDITIRDSLSDGFGVIASAQYSQPRRLSDTRLERTTITNSGTATPGHHDLWVSGPAAGSMTIVQSKIADVKNDSPDFHIFSK